MADHFWIAVEWVLSQPRRSAEWKTDYLRRLGEASTSEQEA